MMLGPKLKEFIGLDGIYLPNRNALFILLASYYGNKIVIGSTEGDAYPDKSTKFLVAMSVALNESVGESQFEVISPLLGMTKIEAVQEYRKAGFPMSDLDQTTSCYHEKEHECMACGSCLRRLIAFACSGHREDEVEQHVDKIWNRINLGVWSGSTRENEQTIKYLTSRKLSR